MYFTPIENETPLVKEYLGSNISYKELSKKYHRSQAALFNQIERERSQELIALDSLQTLYELKNEISDEDLLGKRIKGGKVELIKFSLSADGLEEFIRTKYEDKLLRYKEIYELPEVKSRPFVTLSRVKSFIKTRHMERNFTDPDEGRREIQRRANIERDDRVEAKWGVRNPMYSQASVQVMLDRRGVRGWEATEYVKTWDEYRKIVSSPNNLQKHVDKMRGVLGVASITTYELASSLGISQRSLQSGGKYSFSDFRKELSGINSNKGSSYEEKELIDFVNSVTGSKVITKSRPNFMNNLELDIYIPEYNFAIEFNGSYWHSDKHKNRTYHKHKTELARKAGVTLMHIWEYDWNDPVKQDILKSQIAYKLHSNKVKHYYARKLTLKEVSSKDSRDFLDENHIQGAVNASVRYGLYDKDELIALMTFSKTQKARQEEWELKRFVTKKYTSVAGGMSKLLKAFIKEYGTNLMSYANNDFAYSNAAYSKLGFVRVGSTVPGYKWVRGNNVISRNKAQVKRLKAGKVSSSPYLENDTENSYMGRIGYHKVYDAGNDIYVYKVN